LNNDEVQRRLDKASRMIASAESDLAAERFDAAIGGAYYAAFHSVVGFLIADNCERGPGERWSHGYVQYEFAVRTGILEDRLVRKLYRRLYDGRITADYTTRDIDSADAWRAVEWAKRVNGFCAANLVTEPARGAVAVGDGEEPAPSAQGGS
jgi:uncharacterized protein (UPF0332 family)